jgi:hypothetical protein
MLLFLIEPVIFVDDSVGIISSMGILEGVMYHRRSMPICPAPSFRVYCFAIMNVCGLVDADIFQRQALLIYDD